MQCWQSAYVNRLKTMYMTSRGSRQSGSRFFVLQDKGNGTLWYATVLEGDITYIGCEHALIRERKEGAEYNSGILH